MLDGLCQVEGTCHVACRPDVPWSEYLWEDAEGEVHSIAQGEGGEQGDPKMPLLCAVGQHQTLDIVSRSSREDEKLLAYFDDIHFSCESDRVGQVYTVVQEALQPQASAHTVVRRRCGTWLGKSPLVCDVLEHIAKSLCSLGLALFNIQISCAVT